jgi:tetratricopeptide (TPR) repeat protein
MIHAAENIQPTLCLNMIVKNESQIVIRLFESVLPIIDCYCICDTGSTDNTIEIITNYFSSKNIPGKIVTEPFKNFCHNRNFSLNSCIGMSDYILLLDADMILQINNFDKKTLNMYDSFNILQGNDTFYYQNTRIIKNNGLYNYFGVTHEYINTPPNNKGFIEKNNLFILDVGDGGCKQNKFKRDIELLTNGLLEEPNNARYYFYLANSYHDFGNHEKAIEIYEKRIKLGGWIQEIWYSYYRIGLCYKKLNNIPNAIFNWLNAYNCFPERIENLYEIILYYRNNSNSNLAYHFYNLADNIINKKNKIDDYLFLQKDIYDYKIDYEFSISACYVNIKNINKQIINILNNCSNNLFTDNLLNNMKFYKDILKPKQIINFDEKMIIDVNGINTEFNSSSSCLLYNNQTKTYFMNIRFVNYYLTDKSVYLNCDKHIITFNKFIELDKNFKIIKEKIFDLNFEDRRYIGIEDIRIFNDSLTNNIVFIGSGYHQNNHIGIVYGDYNLNNEILQSNELNCSFNNSSCEKNWVYVNYKNSTHIIYKWNPLQICKINSINENTIDLIENKEMPKIFSHIRGSTCGFKYVKNFNKNICVDYFDSYSDISNIIFKHEEIEIWFVLHLVSYETPRHYYHIIAVFDKNMNLLRYSAPFKFQDIPIEYCLSIVVENDRVLMNYSGWDRTTRIGIYDKEYIDSILKYN